MYVEGWVWVFSFSQSLVVLQTFLFRIVISYIWQGWLIKRYTYTQEHTNWQSHSHKHTHSLCALICGEPQTLTQLLIFMWRHLTPIYHKIKLQQHLSLSCCFFSTETRNEPWNRTAVENACTHTHTQPVILSHTSLNPCEIMNEPLTNPVISPSRLSLWKSAICKETLGEPLCPYSFFDAVFESSLCIEFWI